MWTPSWVLRCDRAEGELSCLEVTEGELVVLAPALWDVLAPLLDQGVEPREDEEQLSLLCVLRGGHVIEGPLQVVSQARWRLVSDFQA